MCPLRRAFATLSILLGAATQSSAWTPRLVEDIGDHLPVSAGSQPFALATVGDRVTFLARPSDDSIVRLYSSDGTTAGTRELALPALDGSANAGLLVGTLDDSAIYALRTGTATYVFVTDGVAELPRLLRKELGVTLPLQAGSAHARSARVDGVLFYFVSRPTAQESLELWRTAGTVATTWRVAALPFAVGTVELGPVASGKGVVYFVASESWLAARALWRSDGTIGGTFELLAAGPEGYFDDLEALETEVLLVESDFEDSTLWVSNGTLEGTFPLADVTGIRWHPAFDYLVTDGHTLVFTRATEEHPLEVWLTRGDPESTRRVAQIDDLSANEHASGIAPYTALVSGRALLSVVDAERRLDLWSVDLASGATSEIATVGTEGHYLVDGTGDGERAWLAIVETAEPSTVWTSDGSSGGTIRVFRGEHADPFDDLHLGAPFDGRLLFDFRPGLGPLHELWSTDGTPGGTRLLTSDLTRAWRGFGFSSPAARDLAAAGASIFFAAADPHFGWELWRASAQAATQVADLRLDRAGIDWLEVLGEVEDELVVAATDPFTDRWEILAISSGAEGGRLLFERPYDCSRHGCNLPRAVYTVGDRAVYLEWGSDVAPSIALSFDPATGAVEDLLPADWHATGEEAQPSRGELVLLGTSDGATSIFATDGTRVGTRSLIAFPGAYAHYYSSLGRVGERWVLWESSWPEQRILAFDLETRRLETLIDDERLGFVRWARSRDGVALDFDVTPPPGGSASREVWWTDGTPTGTRRAFHPADYSLSRLLADGASSTFLFSTYDHATGDSELWISDGTPERSRRILSEAGSSLELGERMVGFRGLLVFELTARRDFVERRELWRTDGSAEGTYRLHSTPYNASGTYLWSLEPAALGDRLLFRGRDPEHGVELWSTDGTIAGTALLADLEPGPVSSSPANLVRFGDRLILAAWSSGVGRELWSARGEPGSAELVADLFPGEASATPNLLGAFGDHLLFLADDGVVGRELWSLDGAEYDPCAASERTLCLGGGRFRVSATWREFTGLAGEATAVPLTADSGYLWFFDPANPELLVKVLDACGTEARNYWVFTTGLTDVEVTLDVQDSWSGETKRIETGLAEPFLPTFDSGSFHVCDAAAVEPTRVAAQAASLGPTLPLLGGRFEAEASWRYPGASGVGEAVALSDQAGYFWFFHPDNVELLVKVLDGCPLQPYPAYWVFAGGLTDLEVVLTVRDLFTGRVYSVATPGGIPFPPVLDAGAFATCP